MCKEEVWCKNELSIERGRKEMPGVVIHHRFLSSNATESLFTFADRTEAGYRILSKKGEKKKKKKMTNVKDKSDKMSSLSPRPLNDVDLRRERADYWIFHFFFFIPLSLYPFVFGAFEGYTSIVPKENKTNSAPPLNFSVDSRREDDKVAMPRLLFSLLHSLCLIDWWKSHECSEMKELAERLGAVWCPSKPIKEKALQSINDVV